MTSFQNTSTYVAKGLFRNGYFGTFYPYLFRKKVIVPYVRKRISTFDGDFLDLDLIDNGEKRVAILLHGLEGSSRSQYILGAASYLSSNGWDICAVNHRSCSGEINLASTMYHSGWTSDLPQIIDSCKDYERIVIIGYSLGGNMALKFAGEQGEDLDPRVSNIVAYSVPIDLADGAVELKKTKNSLFVQEFLSTLRSKMREKAKQYPDLIDIGALSKVKTLTDFDNYFTGPIHGFEDAQGYYRNCSSKQFLPLIKRNSVLISALDDPFLGPECYPHQIAADNSHFNFIETEHGGHCGFGSLRSQYYWSEKVLMELL